MKKPFVLIFMLFLLFSGRSQETSVPEETLDIVPMAIVEEPPVFPGCEKLEDTSARKKCMSDKLKKFVDSKLDAALGGESGLSGVYRVYARFKIDKSGAIVDIRVRGEHPDLERETEKAIGMLPTITPGMRKGKPIGVLYSLPVVFKVKDGKE